MYIYIYIYVPCYTSCMFHIIHICSTVLIPYDIHSILSIPYDLFHIIYSRLRTYIDIFHIYIYIYSIHIHIYISYHYDY